MSLWMRFSIGHTLKQGSHDLMMTRTQTPSEDPEGRRVDEKVKFWLSLVGCL